VTLEMLAADSRLTCPCADYGSADYGAPDVEEHDGQRTPTLENPHFPIDGAHYETDNLHFHTGGLNYESDASHFSAYNPIIPRKKPDTKIRATGGANYEHVDMRKLCYQPDLGFSC
jgi:hypothetical protein